MPTTAKKRGRRRVAGGHALKGAPDVPYDGRAWSLTGRSPDFGDSGNAGCRPDRVGELLPWDDGPPWGPLGRLRG